MSYKICKRCAMDTSDPDIVFDEKGICNHCKKYFSRKHEFIYDESPMEIFGQAKEIEQNVITHLTSLYKSMPKDYKLRIVGDDLGRAKSSTLWFLAKYGVSCDEISFYNSTTVNEMWGKTDIFITADVDIIESKPEGKELIIVNRLYNEGHECDMRIDELKQIKSFEEIYELEE